MYSFFTQTVRPPNKQKRWNCEKSTVFYKCRTKKRKKWQTLFLLFVCSPFLLFFGIVQSTKQKQKGYKESPKQKHVCFFFFLIFRRAFFIFCNNKGIVLQKSFELYSEGIKLFFKRGATTDVKISSSRPHASFENTSSW